MAKLDMILREAYEAAKAGKQALIACEGGVTVIVAPAPKFDPSACEPPLLIARDAKPCTCGLGGQDPCPVHQPNEAHALARGRVIDALRAGGICGHISGVIKAGEIVDERVCLLALPCEVEGHAIS